jgi:hypothetical protein
MGGKMRRDIRVKAHDSTTITDNASYNTTAFVFYFVPHSDGSMRRITTTRTFRAGVSHDLSDLKFALMGSTSSPYVSPENKRICIAVEMTIIEF